MPSLLMVADRSPILAFDGGAINDLPNTRRYLGYRVAEIYHRDFPAGVDCGANH